MSRMNKPWQLFLARQLTRLPKPVALFILDRIMHPLALMVCAALMAVIFPLFMATVIVIAPFSPKGARELFFHIMGSLGK